MVEFSEKASGEVDAYYDYLYERSPRAAERFKAGLKRVIEALAACEFDGPQARLKSGERVQTWTLPPLRLYYQRRGDWLFVVRVHHGSKRPIERTSRRQSAAQDAPRFPWPWPPRSDDD